MTLSLYVLPDLGRVTPKFIFTRYWQIPNFTIDVTTYKIVQFQNIQVCFGIVQFCVLTLTGHMWRRCQTPHTPRHRCLRLITSLKPDGKTRGNLFIVGNNMIHTQNQNIFVVKDQWHKVSSNDNGDSKIFNWGRITRYSFRNDIGIICGTVILLFETVPNVWQNIRHDSFCKHVFGFPMVSERR